MMSNSSSGGSGSISKKKADGAVISRALSANTMKLQWPQAYWGSYWGLYGGYIGVYIGVIWGLYWGLYWGYIVVILGFILGLYWVILGLYCNSYEASKAPCTSLVPPKEGSKTENNLYENHVYISIHL